MVARDGVVIWVQVFASRIWGVALEGCVVGAGSAWHWRSITAAWVIGGFSVSTGHGARWACHLWAICDFADAGLVDGGAHVWGWRVVMSEWGVNHRPLGDFLLTSCSHRWGGSSGEA